MKCVCGYEHKIDYCDKENNIGDEEFISIEGNSFHITEGFEENKIHLLACPKCKTVKMATRWEI